MPLSVHHVRNQAINITLGDHYQVIPESWGSSSNVISSGDTMFGCYPHSAPVLMNPWWKSRTNFFANNQTVTMIGNKIGVIRIYGTIK